MSNCNYIPILIAKFVHNCFILIHILDLQHVFHPLLCVPYNSVIMGGVSNQHLNCQNSTVVK